MHTGTSGVILAAGLTCLLLAADNPVSRDPVQPIPIPRLFPLTPGSPAPGVLPPGSPAPGVSPQFRWWESPALPYAVPRLPGTVADEMRRQMERFRELRRKFEIERRLGGDTSPFRGMVIPVTPPPDGEDPAAP